MRRRNQHVSKDLPALRQKAPDCDAQRQIGSFVVAAAAIAALCLATTVTADAEGYKFFDVDTGDFRATNTNVGKKFEIVMAIQIYSDHAEGRTSGYIPGLCMTAPRFVRFEFNRLTNDQISELREGYPTPPIACLAHWDITLVSHRDTGKDWPGSWQIVSLDGWHR